jgi:hypothetical protein
MPMTASCVRKAPPFLLRPNTSTDFHFFPLGFPFVHHFLVIAPLASPTLTMLTP